MATFRHNVSSLSDAAQVFAKHVRMLPSVGYRAVRLGQNTLLRRIDDAYAVRYHSTDVVIFESDGSITLDAEGFITKTTAARMHAFTPQSVRVSYCYAGGDYRLMVSVRGLRYVDLRTWDGPHTLRAAIL